MLFDLYSLPVLYQAPQRSKQLKLYPPWKRNAAVSMPEPLDDLISLQMKWTHALQSGR